MQWIQDFKHEKEDTAYMMCTRLAWFAVEFDGVFMESQLVKVLLSKIDKRLLDLAIQRIILDHGGRAILEQAFIKVERCGKALC